MPKRAWPALRSLLGTASIAAISSAMPLAAALPPPTPESWIGDLRVGESVTTVQVTVDDAHPTSSHLSVLPLGPSDLKAIEGIRTGTGTAERIALTFELGDTPVRLELPRAGAEAKGRLDGSAADGGGAYAFRRLAAGPAAESVLGFYRLEAQARKRPLAQAASQAPSGSIVARFAEFGPWLFLTDLESGEIGPLLPVGPGRYLWGATIASPVLPPRALVEIDGAGRLRIERAASDGGPSTGSGRATGGGAAGSGAPAGDERTQGAPRYRRERFARSEIRFQNGALRLAGTLTRPAGPRGRPGLQEVPGIVLLHGSGPEDRHYLEIWTQLFAAQGLAVLAYDKRGTGASQGDWQESGLEELAADAIAAVRCLRAQPGVDPARTGVFGISQGGWIAPQVAAALPDLAFVLVHAGAAGTPAEQGRDLLAAEMRAYGLGDDEVAKADALQRLSDEVTRGHRPWNDYKAAYDQAVADKAVWILGPADAEDSPFRRLFRHLLDFDPLPYWARVRCPVLALYGDHDWIVPAATNAPRLRAAFAKAGLTRAEVQVLPGGNHVMLAADSGVQSEYPSRQRFVPSYFTTLRDWLARTLKNK